MTVGLPEDLRDGSSISVVKVTDGGNIQVFQDKDNNPDTVTFDASYGEAAYGLVEGISNEEAAALKKFFNR